MDFPDDEHRPFEDRDGATGDDAPNLAPTGDEGPPDLNPPMAREQRTKLMTAQELSHGPEKQFAPQADPQVDPDCYQPRMIVRHPEYGLGRIVTIHGTGQRRTATIHFFSLGRQHTFYLAHSQLRPLG